MSGMYSSMIVDPGGSGVTSEIKRNKINDITKTIAPIIVLPLSQSCTSEVFLKRFKIL